MTCKLHGPIYTWNLYCCQMKIIGIDVGHTNLAMVVAEVGVHRDEIRGIKVIHSQMSDLGMINCPGDCLFLPHDRSSAHKCHHWVESCDKWFSGSDLVVMERQPLCGLTGIEQSIYIYVKQRYSGGSPNHIRLLSPNSMHCHFNMSRDKVVRRKVIVEISREYLEESPAFRSAREKDHLADAFGFILFYCQTILPSDLLAKMPNRFLGFAYTVDPPVRPQVISLGQ